VKIDILHLARPPEVENPGSELRVLLTNIFGQFLIANRRIRVSRRFGNRPLAKITRTGKMPIPQKTFFLVERASCPFQNLIKRTFARGLLKLPKENLGFQTTN